MNDVKTQPTTPTLIHGLLLGLLLALPWLAAPAPLEAQETPFFGEMVDVRVINVEAVVSSRGQRLTGLEKKDFRLLVDRAEVPIDFFSEAGAPGTSPPAVSYLVFFDDFFTIPSRRDPALEGLRASLVRLRPQDRMAIVAYDGRRLQVLCPPTSDRLELQRVLLEAKKRPAYGLQRRSEASRSFSQLHQLNRPSSGSYTGIGFDGAARATAFDFEPVQEIFGKVEQLSVAAASALRGFQGGEGRKVLLLFSGGVPVGNSDISLFRDPYRRELTPFLQASKLYRPLLETANRLGYTVYPVDLSAEPAAALTSAASASFFDQQRLREDSLSVKDLNQDLHSQVASATGGIAIFGGAGRDVLERVQEDLASYYWLGFKPKWRGDDQAHQLKIEVLRQGAKVRARSNFADLSRDAQLDLQVESAHLFDAPLPISSSFAVRAGDPRPAGGARMLVSTSFEIPADQLSWAKEGDDNVARPELRIAATDEFGNAADLPNESIELRLPGEIQPGQKALYQTTLKLRQRPHRLLIALYDPPSGRLLAQKISVQP